MTNESAIKMGIALKPGKGADPEAWANTLRRTILVVNPDGIIIHVEQPDDQEVMPDFDPAISIALEGHPK